MTVALGAGLGIAFGLLFTLLALQVGAVKTGVAVAGLLVCAGLALRPEIALLLTVTTIPLEGLGRLTPGTSTVVVSVAKIFGLTAFAGWAIRAVIRRERITLPPEFVMLVAFWTVGLLTLLHTTDMPHGTARASSFFATFVYYLVIVNLVRDAREVQWLVCGLLGMTVLMGLFALAQRFMPGFVIFTASDQATDAIGVYRDLSEINTLGVAVDRSGGTAGSPHVYASNLLVAIPLYLVYARIAPKASWRMLALGGAALAGVNLFLTQTRAALLVLAACLALLLAKRVIRLSPAAVAGATLAMLAALPLLPESVYERLLDPHRYSLAGSGTLATRLDYWRAGIGMLEENWLRGMGLGNFSDLANWVTNAEPNNAFMHNIYLQMLNEVGVFGFGFLLAFLVLTYRSFSRAARLYRLAGREDLALLAAALQVGYLGVLGMGMTIDVLHFAIKDWWFVAATAVVLRSDATRRARLASGSEAAIEPVG